MAEPKLVCAACGQVEVGVFCPFCPDCIRELKRINMDTAIDNQYQTEMRRDAFGEPTGADDAT